MIQIVFSLIDIVLEFPLTIIASERAQFFSENYALSLCKEAGLYI